MSDAKRFANDDWSVERIALVEQPRGLPREQPRRLDLRGHVRDQEVDALVHRDRLPELDALARVVDRELVRGPGDADGTDRRARGA